MTKLFLYMMNATGLKNKGNTCSLYEICKGEKVLKNENWFRLSGLES